MTVNSDAAGAPVQAGHALGPRYKWIALSNTTLGMLMATINQSIVLIALPDIFHGIGLDPLSPGNTSYLLWMFMGFLVVTAVLVVSFGRLGDMFGRVRMYTLGFAIFSVASVFLTVTWMHGADGAMWLIIWRVVQGIGGAFLFANAAAIVTDAFPANQRGTALSVNSIAAIAGSFIGLILGGVLAPVRHLSPPLPAAGSPSSRSGAVSLFRIAVRGPRAQRKARAATSKKFNRSSLTSHKRRKVRTSSRSAFLPSPEMPALLTRMSSVPAWRAAAAMLAGSLTSRTSSRASRPISSTRVLRARRRGSRPRRRGRRQRTGARFPCRYPCWRR